MLRKRFDSAAVVKHCKLTKNTTNKKNTTTTTMSNYQIYTGEIKIKQPKIKVRIYHETQGEALNHLQEVLFQMGYTITEFEGIEHVAYGTTNRYQFPLHSEDPKNKSKVVLVQLYRMDSGRYELNFYTNR